MTAVNEFLAQITVQSPGRINFIGGHTDYNQGYVLPTAIDKRIYFEFRRNESEHEVKVYSKTYNTAFKYDLRQIQPSQHEWENYLLGVTAGLQKLSNKIHGFDCILRSDVPIGAGVSSSAALECGFALGLNELFDLGLDRLTLAKVAQKAEHDFVGTQCGIMDQFAALMSEANKVILLDCQSNTYDLIDAEFGDYQILLLNTNVSHNLATSDYNTRRNECEAAVLKLAQEYPDISSLRDANAFQLEQCKKFFSETEYKRASFIVAENQRVLKAAQYLQAGQLREFGELIYQSHAGLQDLYEVSCAELDFLVDFSRDKDYVIASRMMGGGFGGCTLNLIHKDHVDKYIDEVKAAYQQTFNIELTAFVTVASQGTSFETA